MHAPEDPRLTRRFFVQGLAATGLAAGFSRSAVHAAEGAASAALSGREISLRIAAQPVNFTGRAAIATAINGTVPAPLLRLREGDTVTIHVRNELAVTSSIHWHGLILPANMDGIPGLSFAGIAAHSTFTYQFELKQSGTYWYHAHSAFQEQTGLYGPLVIDPRDGERHAADREHVILLSDWTDRDPARLFATLKRQSDHFNFGKRTVVDLLRDARREGVSAALAERRMWAQMRMQPTDILDVSGHAYTYLMNGSAPAANWTGLFRPGETVRLRFINGSAMSIFDVRIPGLPMRVVAVDGQDVEAVTVDEFRLGTAETLDVIVGPLRDEPYTVFAQAMDRSGYTRGTLAPRPGLSAAIPALDPRPLLTMGDMGMGHDMAGMDHQHTPSTLRHAPAEFGPGVDNRISQARAALGDPGVGLRDNGRRVLTYADLHTLGGPLDARPPGREFELHLTGHMERFMWSFNGQKFSEAEPLRLQYGERVRITLVNDTMMTHPIHLHGMWSELEADDGSFLVRKHTVMVQPAQKLSYQVTADALGRWAYHCHMLYHMEAGMFREVVVSQGGDRVERDHEAH
jgi:FtsP/CotA-like multicopper oxidase with cupredoxin domain